MVNTIIYSTVVFAKQRIAIMKIVFEYLVITLIGA